MEGTEEHVVNINEMNKIDQLLFLEWVNTQKETGGLIKILKKLIPEMRVITTLMLVLKKKIIV